MELKIIKFEFKEGFLVGELEIRLNGSTRTQYFGMQLVKGSTKEWLLPRCPFNGPLRGEIMDFLDRMFPRIRKSFLRLFNGNSYAELRKFVQDLKDKGIIDKGQAKYLQRLITIFEKDRLPIEEAITMMIEKYED